jgi:hypothetical protein
MLILQVPAQLTRATFKQRRILARGWFDTSHGPDCSSHAVVCWGDTAERIGQAGDHTVRLMSCCCLCRIVLWVEGSFAALVQCLASRPAVFI